MKFGFRLFGVPPKTGQDKSEANAIQEQSKIRGFGMLFFDEVAECTRDADAKAAVDQGGDGRITVEHTQPDNAHPDSEYGWKLAQATAFSPGRAMSSADGDPRTWKPHAETGGCRQPHGCSV